MNREEIQKIIPHRGGMLLVDEVCREGDICRGSYRVRGDEWFLDGHFPGNPLVPGVILCEIVAQCACLLVVDDQEAVQPFYAGMDKVRFRRPVRPGDVLMVETRLKRRIGSIIMASGRGKVGDEVAVELDFSVALSWENSS
ncbi:MAG: beta-hydroxyacyl-ACP dehydratase [Clostridiales bacterium]|nr:beta-hydroxyacyl-ACP dehydratase [Clostridiales bacterium]